MLQLLTLLENLIYKINQVLKKSFYILGISSELLLHNKHKFPDSLFSASASSKSHSASDARISSGSSWCAPVGKHFLQVDLGRRYRLDYLVTYGDSKSKKWVATYKLNYTIDLKNWKTLPKVRKNISRIQNEEDHFRCEPVEPWGESVGYYLDFQNIENFLIWSGS
jgi:hypothetical protein